MLWIGSLGAPRGLVDEWWRPRVTGGSGDYVVVIWRAIDSHLITGEEMRAITPERRAT